MFGPAREAAGVSEADLPGDSVGAVIAAARAQFGEPFCRVVDMSRVWLNGDEAMPEMRVADRDEVAVIPPVSGG
jgi:molybdopterin converting factor small subunit